eukprot:207624_1
MFFSSSSKSSSPGSSLYSLKISGFALLVLVDTADSRTHSPILPFVLANYLFGVTSISLTHYVIAFVVELQGAFFQAFIGSGFDHLSNLSDAKHAMDQSPLSIVFLVVGIVATILAGIGFTIFGK